MSFILNSVGDGIVIVSNDNTIINNIITEPENNGVLVFLKDRNIIKGNTIVNSRFAGIALLEDCFETCRLSNDNQVLDNTIISSGLAGINLDGKHNVIQGNTINQSGENGIDVGTFSEGLIIKDNSITNSEYGIAINSASLNTVVIGNTLAGNTFGPIDTERTDIVFAGNVPNLM